MTGVVETPIFFSRADAREVSTDGSVLRMRLANAMQLPKNAAHSVYLDQLSATNDFKNCSPAMGNASLHIAPIDPSKWTLQAVVSAPIVVTYSPVPGSPSNDVSVTIPAATYLAETLVNDLNNAFKAQGYNLAPSLTASTLAWTWSLGSGSIAYSPGDEAAFNTALGWIGEPDPAHVVQVGELPRGNYTLDSAGAAVNTIYAAQLASSGVCILDISMDVATGRIVLTPDASNTHTPDLRPGRSECLRQLFGFAPPAETPVWLNAAAGIAAAGGSPYQVTLAASYEASQAATFDKFSTLQVHTPLAQSIGSDGKPGNAIAQMAINVAVGHTFAFHPPRELLVPATPAFSIDTLQVSLQTPDGTHVDTDEDWSVVIVVRSVPMGSPRK